MKQQFKLSVTGGLLCHDRKEVLLLINPDFDIKQRKSYDEYYHHIYEVPVYLSFSDLDMLAKWFKVELYSGYDLVLDI
ncbi:hypothetical protein NVP1187O_027 [Vibrio phage 1.187.O._10N.286.49.F1]|nr:hypothetical protein NVP1187O_027 [Vibrio phage 1.187.O._10N.286.49.F1]